MSRPDPTHCIRDAEQAVYDVAFSLNIHLKPLDRMPEETRELLRSRARRLVHEVLTPPRLRQDFLTVDAADAAISTSLGRLGYE